MKSARAEFFKFLVHALRKPLKTDRMMIFDTYYVVRFIAVIVNSFTGLAMLLGAG